MLKKVDSLDFNSEKCAVFTNDSYAERKKVHERCCIPVFAPDCIDVLLNHRILL